MIRRIVVISCLVVSIGILVLWCVSFVKTFAWHSSPIQRIHVALRLADGHLELWCVRKHWGALPDDLHKDLLHVNIEHGLLFHKDIPRKQFESPFNWRVGRLALLTQMVPGFADILAVGVPLWVPFGLFSAYPCVAFIRGPYRRYRRRKKGLCLKCGYNLTCNVSGVCPECGERI